MKRKFFATLLCLLMMATLLPVGSTAIEVTETSILSNGDFEDGLNNWTKQTGTDGEIIKEADTPAVGYTAVSPLSGSAFKIVEGDTIYYQELVGLVEGRSYVVEGYVNAPVNNQGPRVFIGRGRPNVGSATYAEAIYGSYAFAANGGADVTTEGWLKFSYSFVYDTSKSVETANDVNPKKWYLVLRNTNDKPVYYDEINVYPTDEKIILYEAFDSFTKDNKLTLTTKLTLGNSSKGEFVFLSENGVQNGVWETAEQTEDHPNYQCLSTTKDFSSLFNAGDLLHLRLRAKNVQGGTYTTNPKIEFSITGGTSRMTNAIDLSLNNGDWVNYDYWFVGDSNTWVTLAFLMGATSGWYIDDLIISIAEENSFVGDGKILKVVNSDRTLSGKTFTVWGRASLAEGYTSADTVIPFVRFATTNETESAMTLTAVHKNKGGNRQLLHVITEILNAKASKPAYSTKTIDLSTLGLSEEDGATYTVETYLLKNDGTILPIANHVSIPVTIAAATIES